MNDNFRPSGLFRRLAALVYDALLAVAMIFIAALPLPLIQEYVQTFWWIKGLEQIYLITAWFLYFGWFWTHGGQTVGMKAWRLKLLRLDGERLKWRDACVRFLVSFGYSYVLLALVGLHVLSINVAYILATVGYAFAFLWIVVDRNNYAWHDQVSHTKIVLVPPRPR